MLAPVLLGVRSCKLLNMNLLQPLVFGVKVAGQVFLQHIVVSHNKGCMPAIIIIIIM